MKLNIIAVFLLFLTTAASAQQGLVSGVVQHEKQALAGANVYWKGTTVGTTTNAEGRFSLPDSSAYTVLVVSFVGYLTLEIPKSEIQNPLVIELEPDQTLGEVTIEGHRSGKEILSMEPLLLERLGQKELKKAACCNLSESFETNASVDVNFADAITGARKVRMLGLDGVYSLITIENMPDVRGLASSFGLSAIPGPWIQSIQLAKGVGSVVNGYESITGQINVELMKPHSAPRFHFNGYSNSMGRFETSLNGQFRVSDKLNTLVMFHTNSMDRSIDANEDGFLDVPRQNQVTLTNRWMYYNDKIESQFGVELLAERRLGGQMGYTPMQEHNMLNPWGMNVRQNRLKAYAKLGFLPNDEHPKRSLGIINKFSYYNQDAVYGLKFYDGTNNYWYTNVIFQDEVINRNHLIKAGAGFFIDKYVEKLDDQLNQYQINRARTEQSAGVFAEYTYHPNVRFTSIIGGRLDYHNLFGAFVTPRLHLRYKLRRNLTWRYTGGSGRRTPNMLVDNSRVMVSSRTIVIPTKLIQEKAWNTGTSLVWDVLLSGREGSITLDAYHTEFVNMMVMDMDASAQTLSFYNLNGRSFASVAQIEVNYELLRGLDVRASYKIQDVKTTYSSGQLRSLPFVAKNKWLLNAAYNTPNRMWGFDATALRTNPGRIAATVNNPDFEMPCAFWRFNAQITFRYNGLEIYTGGENLSGFKQKNPIISAQSPFDPSFDAANVWAPIYGRMVYLGVRYTHF
ncbi:TonB-dependent receptor [bacterium]|nr:TonB-dependent receptor [bacterium]